MKNFSLKALGAFIASIALVVAGISGAALSANAVAGAGTLAWNGATPTFTNGTLPALSFDFTPSAGNASTNFDQIKIEIYNSAGTASAYSMLGIQGGSSMSASGCFLASTSSISGQNINHTSIYCAAAFSQGGNDGARYYLGQSSGAFTMSINSGLFTSLTRGDSYKLRVTTQSSAVDQDVAMLDFSIPAAPNVSSIPTSISGTVGTSLTQPITYTPTNFPGPYTYSSNSLPPGLMIDQQNGSISGVPTSQTQSAWVLITVTGANNVTASTGVTISISSSGNNNVVSNPSTAFTATGTFVDGNSVPITNLPANALIPAFTMTASSLTNSATYTRAGVIFSSLVTSPAVSTYFTVANPQNANLVVTYTAWDPANATCGITAISLGGVSQNSSSGITCAKETWTSNLLTGYAVRLVLPAATNATLSVSVADNVFTSGIAGNYRARLALSSNPLGSPYYTGGTAVNFSVGGVNAPSQPAATAELSLSATTGQLVAGSTVGVSASGLQSTASYTVTVQSTPQTIGSGNAVSGAVNTNVTLPSGLEAGWHTLTFTSTASDGSSVVSKYYFKISSNGTLLATSSAVPAELAYTGSNAANMSLLLFGGLSLALVGAEMFMIARRKRSN